MLNISTFYKKNKLRFQSAFSTQITNAVYATDRVFNSVAVNHIIQEIIRTSINNQFFAKEAFNRIIFDFDYANKFITLLCTIDNLYIHPYNMNPIHLSNNCDAYIIPKTKYTKEMVLLALKSRVIAGGVIKDNTIIWDRKIRLDKVCFMYIDLEKHPEAYTDEIISNYILNNLR